MMKKQQAMISGFVLTSCLLLTSSSVFAKEIEFPKPLSKKRRLINKIVARVKGSNILLSDLKRPLISHSFTAYVAPEVFESEHLGLYKLGLEQAIDDQLLLIRAIEREVMPTASDVEKQVSAFKIENGMSKMSEEDFNFELQKDGLTSHSYRKQIQRALGIRNLQQAEASERVVVTLAEKRRYFDDHPEAVEEVYTLKIANFTFSQLGSTAQATQRELLNRTDIVWEDIPPLKKSEIGREFKEVFSMKNGAISQPIRRATKYQLVMLVKRDKSRNKTFDEQEVAIERALTEEKSKRFMNELLADLRKDATIYYL